jgi:hypothetical protein
LPVNTYGFDCFSRHSGVIPTAAEGSIKITAGPAGLNWRFTIHNSRTTNSLAVLIEKLSFELRQAIGKMVRCLASLPYGYAFG